MAHPTVCPLRIGPFAKAGKRRRTERPSAAAPSRHAPPAFRTPLLRQTVGDDRVTRLRVGRAMTAGGSCRPSHLRAGFPRRGVALYRRRSAGLLFYPAVVAGTRAICPAHDRNGRLGPPAGCTSGSRLNRIAACRASGSIDACTPKRTSGCGQTGPHCQRQLVPGRHAPFTEG